MNEFRLHGRVIDLKERLTKRGNRWIIATVQDDLGELVPVAMFGRLPRVGDEVFLTGRLTGWNGYLTLKIEEKLIGEQIDRCGSRFAVGTGSGRGIPETDHFEDDDLLPF